MELAGFFCGNFFFDNHAVVLQGLTEFFPRDKAFLDKQIHQRVLMNDVGQNQVINHFVVSKIVTILCQRISSFIRRLSKVAYTSVSWLCQTFQY